MPGPEAAEWSKGESAGRRSAAPLPRTPAALVNARDRAGSTSSKPRRQRAWVRRRSAARSLPTAHACRSHAPTTNQQAGPASLRRSAGWPPALNTSICKVLLAGWLMWDSERRETRRRRAPPLDCCCPADSLIAARRRRHRRGHLPLHPAGALGRRHVCAACFGALLGPACGRQAPSDRRLAHTPPAACLLPRACSSMALHGVYHIWSWASARRRTEEAVAGSGGERGTGGGGSARPAGEPALASRAPSLVNWPSPVAVNRHV